MKSTFKNKVKLLWHCLTQSVADTGHSTLEADGEIFCLCGYEDNRVEIEGVDKEYRRLVEYACQYKQNFDIPN